MSLIPSKRVDRIFPVVPALCLLLAAQLKAINIVRIRQLAVVTIILAAIFTGAYSGMRMIDGYRNNRDALVKFGREVRQMAAAEHLRYEILPAPDEGLLLYLQRPRFFNEPPVGCNALVVPLDEEPWSSGGFSYRVTVEKKGDEPSSYGFVAPLPPHR